MPQRIKRHFTGNRREFRSALIGAFVDEEPGTGTAEQCTRYIYEVDASPSGHTIELHRPAFLNKGIDFTVRCLSVVFNGKNPHWRHVPTHDDLIEVLASLKAEYPRRYRDVSASLTRVYHCQGRVNLKAIADISAEPAVPRAEGCPADVAVLIAKWLFAEQDLTYWNNSGRAMLFNKLRVEGLV
jgi:hypothetical protein